MDAPYTPQKLSAMLHTLEQYVVQPTEYPRVQHVSQLLIGDVLLYKVAELTSRGGLQVSEWRLGQVEELGGRRENAV